jgi:hypothetical protein
MTLDIGPVYPEDPRDVEHFDFCGNEIYRAYNLLSKYDMKNLLEEIDNELEVCEDKWDLSVEATIDCLNVSCGIKKVGQTFLN